MIKRLFLVTLFCLFFLFSNAQDGLLNLNDFGPPLWSRYHSRFWLRGSIPQGSNPILEFYGKNQVKFYSDTVTIPKLSLREDANPYKLVWIGQDSMLRAFTPNYLTTQVNSDWNSISGVSEILNKPILKRIETYLGTTDASGNYTVIYATVFSIVPDVQPQLQAGTPSQVVRITSSTTTGFTVQVTNRASVNLLGIDVLLSATTPVSGSSVGVLVISR